MIKPGPRNLITDVPGLKVGNAEDAEARTGVTVLLPDTPVTASVDVRGGGTGTRDIGTLEPGARATDMHALVLSGGSVFGLAAADGVANWLAGQGRGLAVRGATVPIVPAAILFDLDNGGDKEWGNAPPYHDLGERAAASAAETFGLGNIGAGYGARCADGSKGGLGSASIVDDASGATVGALAAANPYGSAVIPGTATLHAWMYEQNGEMGGQTPPRGAIPAADLDYRLAADRTHATTLVAVATDAILNKVEAQRVAIMAQNGMARALRPVHTPFDGDIVFALSTGRQPLPDPANDVARIGMHAADCVTRAIGRAFYEAATLGAFQAYRQRYKT